MERERLFRDDAGAALERAGRLERENAVLRSEIERLRRPRRRPFGLAVLALVVGLALVASAALAVALVRRVTPAPPPVDVAAAMPPAMPAAFPREMSFESAKVWWQGHGDPGKPEPPLGEAELAAPVADVLRACDAAPATAITLKLAVYLGRAAGVSVYTTPRDPKLAACVEQGLRAASWPVRSRMSFATSTY